MSATAWLLPGAAAVAVIGAGLGLYFAQQANEEVRAAERIERVEAASGNRLYLSAAQLADAQRGGPWPQPVRSLLRIDRPMRYGQFEWDDRNVPAGPLWIRVDLRTQLMSVFRGGHEIGTAVVLYGADEKETPLGTFPILWKKRDHVSSLYDAPMPYTLRLTGDGVAIHGSDVRWGAATHGCVGVPKEFASHLFAAAEVGDKVVIVRSQAPKSS